MIAIIDYGAGNLQSVQQALAHVGGRSRIAAVPADCRRADRLVLPGVGAFAAAAAALRHSGWWPALRRWLADDRPFLGICLGMQLLFAGSEESPDAAGLGLLPGICRRFRYARVPQTGWNRVHAVTGGPLWDGIAAGSYFYFVNSYHAPVDGEIGWAAWSDHGGRFPAAVQRGRCLGVQFHPEKSSDAGLRLLANWVHEC